KKKKTIASSRLFNNIGRIGIGLAIAGGVINFYAL
ncbi:unnamed protein product, partial [Rotaria sordida]